MRSLSDSIPASNGCSAACNSGLSPSAFSGLILRTLHPRSRSPDDLASPRAVFTSAVRARTNPARARISVRSACAFALRCFTGDSNCGSILASRARVCASRRSSFFRLSPIRRTLRACATITSCPSSLSRRLTHGECMPVSSAIRLRGIPPNTSRRALGVVLSRCSSSTLPASSSTQYQLERSPRSNPTVNFCCEIFLRAFGATVLTFFIAGLLYLLCFKHVDNLGAYSIPPGDRPSHPICNRAKCGVSDGSERQQPAKATFVKSVRARLRVGLGVLQELLGEPTEYGW